MELGIDLGTTFSVAARVSSQGVPVLVPDSLDATDFSTSSVVHIDPAAAIVGTAVEQLLLEEPKLSVARYFKLKMGQKDAVYVDSAARSWRSESLSALILKKIVRDARAVFGEELTSAVITVPAGFGDAQRRATHAAAILAGLPDVQLAEEPIAAAVYYGLTGSGRDETLLVYDFGGGTFDATLLQASPTGVYAIATDGATVGGKDIDAALVDLAASQFKRQYASNPLDEPGAENQLLKFARDTKFALNKPGTNQVRRTLLIAGRTLDIVVTSAQFERLAAPIIEQTFQAAERTLAAGSVTWPLVDRILLSGGSSLLPMVTEGIRRRGGKSGDQLICRKPHHAVAFGAGILANRRRREASSDGEPVVRPISSYDVGIRVSGRAGSSPGFHVLLPRNAPLPATNTASVYTTRADQQRIVVEVLQRKNAESAVCSLGNFDFGPIRRPRKNYPVEITLAYDFEGVVNVSARDPQTNESMSACMVTEEGVLDRALLEQRGWLQEMRINGI
jgi:molecular chaperone DnaK